VGRADTRCDTSAFDDGPQGSDVDGHAACLSEREFSVITAAHEIVDTKLTYMRPIIRRSQSCRAPRAFCATIAYLAAWLQSAPMHASSMIGQAVVSFLSGDPMSFLDAICRSGVALPACIWSEQSDELVCYADL
jgi:hypothetical protein